MFAEGVGMNGNNVIVIKGYVKSQLPVRGYVSNQAIGSTFQVAHRLQNIETDP